MEAVQVAPTETPALEATPTETKSADESPAAAGEPEEPADDDGETEESADDNENNGDLIFDDTVIETEEIILTDVEPEETAEPVVSEDSEQQEESEETEESDQAEAENTAEASPAPTDPCYALINDEDVSLYSESSDEGTVICQLEKGMRVQLIQTELNDKGEEWAEVIVDEQQGYIMAMYLDMLSPEDSAQPISTPTDMSADGNQ